MQPQECKLPIYNNIAEVIVTLSYLAGQTKKIKLCISTLVLPLRNPILVAKQLATLDYLTEGRIVITFGAGWNEGEFEFLNQNFKNRGRRFNECLAVVRSLWRDETSFHGEFFMFEKASFYPLRPDLAYLPIFVAGNTKYAIKRAVEFGDGWHPAVITGKEIRKALKPYQSQLNNKKFQLSVHVFINKNASLEMMVNEYEEHGISKIVFDLSRGDIKPRKRDEYFRHLCKFVSSY
jgi:alkanesulfonate monooxygenase SsuD/methylene tetrahydromethanopterin reductase-like flavin-dependent oxidoreductase (luciferase family)